MISRKLQTSAAAPATLVSLARVGIAGLSLASLISADAVEPATATVPQAATAPTLGAAVTIQRLRASV
ncbi:hypothetical protein SAMN05216410_0549 [Sanguibacter gelidistatuariae]|uniref:Uncharacterized protein n=1 Tax=Sanguibacter gelidistatuariae TaxID=1814289 RepID=A0A1G6GX87_9MICO|nr:hypothetical protein [Sanguibacter gelidistatuariae]SDB86513.1 hypothetical protein SAMN05216410_0549 [Sanguibacter gelidistatuariae]